MMIACPRSSFLAVPLLAALGCSAPVPLPAQGALFLSVQRPSVTTNGLGCPDSGNTFYIARDTNSRASLTSYGESVIDGDKGAKISCSVRASGAGFVFTGSFTGTTLDGDHPPVTITFDNGVIGDDKVNGTASITVREPNLGGTFSSDAPCPITVLGGAIKPGSMWAKFSCPTLGDPSRAPTPVCAVGDSAIVFGNCDGY
jgi:predicted RNA-binding Zn-ribbon protein involved in translation (DUF1610 family)